MSNRAERRLQKLVNKQPVPQHQKVSMTQPVDNQSKILDEATQKALEAAALVEEAKGIKPSADRVGGESATTGNKGEETTLVDVATYIPKMAWNKVLVPTWDFGKGMVLKGWDRITGFYDSERKLANELGAGRYFLDRVATIGLKVIKMAAVVTLAYFIAEMAMTYFGFELFSPAALLIIGLVALVCIIAKSVMDQRKQGSDVKASVIGSHITEALMAA